MSFAMGIAPLLAFFLPGLLLAVAGAALSSTLAQGRTAGQVLAGVNAAVVGVLAAALFSPVWPKASPDAADILVTVATYGALQSGKLPP